jgi:hypothetical protein
LDNYVGIRKYEEVLSLDIEKDAYPLAKKLIENTIISQKKRDFPTEPEKRTVSDKEVSDVINKNIDIE